jgi:hypothetical protein
MTGWSAVGSPQSYRRQSAAQERARRRRTLVGDQRIGLHRGQEVVRPNQVVCLSAGQEEADRVAQRVDQSVDPFAGTAWAAPSLVFRGRPRAIGVLVAAESGAAWPPL